MNKRPTKGQIARALGISPPALTRYIKRGCPVYSIEAARAWQSQNIDPTQRLMRSAPPAPPPPPPADATVQVQLVHALFQLAAAEFDRYAEDLRQAMRTVPLEARAGVLIEFDVLTKLLPANLTEVVEPDPEGAALQSDAEAESAGLFLYSLACGELLLS